VKTYTDSAGNIREVETGRIIQPDPKIPDIEDVYVDGAGNIRDRKTNACLSDRQKELLKEKGLQSLI
jgi:hypothetical protein